MLFCFSDQINDLLNDSKDLEKLYGFSIKTKKYNIGIIVYLFSFKNYYLTKIFVLR